MQSTTSANAAACRPHSHGHAAAVASTDHIPRAEAEPYWQGKTAASSPRWHVILDFSSCLLKGST
uniref:Uncharacterized protein n=1 Tax=Oryza meridionalis TaxID=40149 RepID=A0A0E0EJN3_9ORYZ